MSGFTASNGVQIVDRPDGIGFQFPGDLLGSVTLQPDAIQALSEYFQAKEDERLGRWRWPENPAYVVYPAPRDGAEPVDFDAFVINEAIGASGEYVRADDDGNSIILASSLTRAARAYFDAHPEPKPWDVAKPGEVWAFTIDGLDGEHAAALHAKGEWTWTDGGPVNVVAGALVGARRIWPETD
jgi:hypothetical protein